MPAEHEHHDPQGPGTADWPARAADLVETVADLIRDRAIRPIALVARALVYGLLVAVATVAIGFLLAIAAIRLLTVYAFPGRVWASDLVVGGVFALLGMLAWSKRSPRPAADGR